MENKFTFNVPSPSIAEFIFHWLKDNSGRGFAIGDISDCAVEGEFDLEKLSDDLIKFVAKKKH